MKPMKPVKKALCALALAQAASAASAEAGNPLVEIATGAGTITIELLPGDAPQTVANFLALVDDGFYDGTIFHRVIPNFMFQGGGYDAALQLREPPRTVPNESANGLKNLRGTIAMARTQDPDSANSQFYINLRDNPHLDATPGAPGYTVFGRVIDGYAVAEEIELVQTRPSGSMEALPIEPVAIVSMQRKAAQEAAAD